VIAESVDSTVPLLLSTSIPELTQRPARKKIQNDTIISVMNSSGLVVILTLKLNLVLTLILIMTIILKIT
jgi:hypothetical protein